MTDNVPEEFIPSPRKKKGVGTKEDKPESTSTQGRNESGNSSCLLPEECSSLRSCSDLDNEQIPM